MRTAVLAVLVEIDCAVAPEQLADSYGHEPETVEQWLDDLVKMEYVSNSDGMYEATKHGRQRIAGVVESSKEPA